MTDMPDPGDLLGTVRSVGFSESLHTKAVEVQFNPSTLKIDSNTENMPVKYMQENMEKIPNTITRNSSIRLSVELIFDAVQNSDAFHADRLRVSASDVVSHAGAFLKKATGDEYSVLKKTNGIIAFIFGGDSPVTFKWGKITFRGLVSEVQARYVMFSPKGYPIRSHVALHMEQAIDNISECKYWDNAYERFFANDSALAAHARDSLQTQQSIFNL
jgi:hypothetical protein